MKPRLAAIPLAVVLAAAPSFGAPWAGDSQVAAAEVAPQSPTARGNAVTDWAAIVAPAVHSAAEPRPPAGSQVLHTVVHLAVYDAVVAITGDHAPYAKAVRAADGANLDAAVATAAYRAARGRVAPTQFAYLDEKYADYLAAIPGGKAKTAGVTVGKRAAAAVLAKRAGDGFASAVSYRCSSTPPLAGEFEPNDGCGTEPVDAKLAKVKPFTSTAAFRANGPDAFGSKRWVTDLKEVAAYGAKDSAVRTTEQTDVAYFWAEHTYIHWNRNLIGLATARNLDVADTARLFAMAHTAAADAVIAGFKAKYEYRTWRPRTAIPRAAEDGNPKTGPNATWTPLLSVNTPEYPSAHAFYSRALTDAVAAFFGTRKVRWTMDTSKVAVPLLVQTERTYRDLDALMLSVGDARVWAGLHYRNSMREGEALGRKIAKRVTTSQFRPGR